MEKILIYSTANNRAGAQKVIADLAYSYRLIGNQVDIALPIFPYHRVFLSKKLAEVNFDKLLTLFILISQLIDKTY